MDIQIIEGTQPQLDISLSPCEVYLRCWLKESHESPPRALSRLHVTLQTDHRVPCLTAHTHHIEQGEARLLPTVSTPLFQHFWFRKVLCRVLKEAVRHLSRHKPFPLRLCAAWEMC